MLACRTTSAPLWFLLLLALALMPPASGRAGATVRPGAVLLQLRPGAQRHGPLALPRGTQVEASLGAGLLSLRVPAGAEQEYSRKLAALPEAAYAQPDHAVAAQMVPNDARYAEQWAPPRIGLPEAWGAISSTETVVVATLDTGVALAHPDLRGQLWQNPGEVAGNNRDDDGNGFVDDVHGWHFFQIYSGGQALPRDDGDLADANGHGTHVAGIIAAAGNNGEGIAGVAWRARVMAVRVLDDDAVGWESDVIRGLRYAVAEGARVVNMSLGLRQASRALAEAVAEAEARGVVVVAAAGNDGGAALYPAAYPTALSVGASDRGDRRAGFSAAGARLDLLAPGVDILSTWSGLPYFARSGTSMAAPHAAGVAALLIAQRPERAPAQVRACLRAAAADLGPPGRDDDTGWGLLSAAHALRGCDFRAYLPFVGLAPPRP
jgi:subtilisin family serine protease